MNTDGKERCKTIRSFAIYSKYCLQGVHQEIQKLWFLWQIIRFNAAVCTRNNEINYITKCFKKQK